MSFQTGRVMMHSVLLGSCEPKKTVAREGGVTEVAEGGRGRGPPRGVQDQVQGSLLVPVVVIFRNDFS